MVHVFFISKYIIDLCIHSIILHSISLRMALCHQHLEGYSLCTITGEPYCDFHRNFEAMAKNGMLHGDITARHVKEFTMH